MFSDTKLTSISPRSFAKQFNKKNNVDVTSDKKAMGKLKREAEKAKRTLSSQMSTRIEIESFFGGQDFSETLTRAKFEELNLDLFKKTLKPVEQVLKGTFPLPFFVACCLHKLTL